MESNQLDKEPTKKEWRGFWTLLFVQAQNALNEKGAQFLLIPLGAAIAAQSAEFDQYKDLKYPLGAIIVLPYLVISPLVGWLSDRFSKTRIVQLMAFLQIVVLLGMLGSLYFHRLDLAIVWFTLFAIQATVLSPAKKGIVKDMVGTRHIGYASSLVEMSTVFAILVGQIVVLLIYGLLNSRWGFDPWESAMWPTVVLIGTAIPLFIVTLFVIPYYPPYEKKPFKWKLFFEHFGQIKELWSDRNLRLSEIGIAYFWFFASVMLLIGLDVAEFLKAADETRDFSLLSAEVFAWLSGGVVLGGIIISRMNRGKVELGTVPMGAVGMTASCILLACLPVDSYFFMGGLTLAGLSGAFFFLPLNAFLQNESEDAKRGNIIAAGNFLDMGLSLVAVGFQMALVKIFNLSIGEQCLVMAFLCLSISLIVLRLIPRDFIKLIGVWLIQLFFRPRVLNVDRMPATGGVLLVSNHVTLADALFLTTACPRPVRFMVAEEYITVRALGWILELFNSVPISNKNPGEALSIASKALKNGEVICIFPEGQLTRTGVMTELRRGIEIVAHRAGAPVIPVYMDGLWGGALSYKNPKKCTKWPTRIPQRFIVAYGNPISHEDISLERVRNEFQELSVMTMEAVVEGGRSSLRRILESQDNKVLVKWDTGSWKASDIMTALLERRMPEGESPGHTWLKSLLDIVAEGGDLSKLWLNGEQLKKVNALRPGQWLMVCVGTGESQENLISIIWPLMTKTPVYILAGEYTIPDEIRQIAGSHEMRKKLEKITPSNHYVPFFDFSGYAILSSIPNVTHRPCYLSPGGEVVAVSMYKEVYIVDKDNLQFGIKFGGHGLLLPGYVSSVNEETGRTKISSPMLEQPFDLPESYFVDASNFILEKIDS